MDHFDILVIGGGINGAGIARDAAGRGYSVCLCEKGDFAGGTSSASTKLFHGGLRYLEYFEFRLVREALIEREVLLRAMPHISWPMRFVLPLHQEMRFESETPASKFLSFVMPWLKGRRPEWMIRFGLFLYDHLGGRKILPGTSTLDLTRDEAGRSLKPFFRKAFEYSDCWVEDSRLVILNLRDAQARGAEINARTAVKSARRENGKWHAELAGPGGTRSITASLVVNAAGPWIDHVLGSVFGHNDAHNVRLVRGSHIVVKKKFDHDRSYFFQNADGRIIFAIPYERDYTLIGTTDADHDDPMVKPEISDAETDYLCAMASEYFAEPVKREDIVWTYSGVRPLYDDGAGKAQAATREYVIRPDPVVGEGRLLNVFGGKITTYRKLAEAVLEKAGPLLGRERPEWTAGVALPGGDFPVDGYDQLLQRFGDRYPFVERKVMQRLVRHHGTEVPEILGDAKSLADLGRDFGNGLHECELKWFVQREWAASAEDILFRRTRLGIRMNAAQIGEVAQWIANTTMP
ncbi:MAG: glycerol-3-phosphate dehydrogenase [Nitratireductor sp.]|nr:glycerol-3-phosphate dehydrogenase [Nitratireductor sp.]